MKTVLALMLAILISQVAHSQCLQQTFAPQCSQTFAPQCSQQTFAPQCSQPTASQCSQQTFSSQCSQRVASSQFARQNPNDLGCLQLAVTNAISHQCPPASGRLACFVEKAFIGVGSYSSCTSSAVRGFVRKRISFRRSSAFSCN